MNRSVMPIARWLVIAIVVFALVVVPRGSGAAQDETQRLLETLGVEIPARPPLFAPPFALPGLDGAQVRLGDLKSRAVMLYFWTTW